MEMSRKEIKHVLIIPSWYPDAKAPHNGTFFREQAQMLKRAGLQVGVLALQSDTRRFSYSRELEISLEDDIPVLRGFLPREIGWGLPGDALLARKAAQPLLKKYAELYGVPDVIQAHSVFRAIYVAAAASRLWKIPYVVTEHRTSSLTRSPWLPRTRSLRKAVQQANGRAAVSTAFAAALSDFYGAPWQVLTLPVLDSDSNTPLPQLGAEEPFVFSHVSYWDERKREKMTLRAFAKMHARLPNTRMVMAGGAGKAMAEVTELRRELGLEEVVDLQGVLPRPQVAKLLAHTHCFVLASCEEAAGIVFAEAQMAGLPCIGTRTFGGEYMISESAGIRVPIDGEDELAEAMYEMAKDRHQKYNPEAVRTQARQRFSEATFIAASEQYYRAALADYQQRNFIK